MKYRCSFVLLALALATCPPAFAASFTLTDAIRYAYENSPTIRKGAGELEISDLEEKNSFARFFPSLDLSTRAGLQDGTASQKTSPWVSQLDLTFSGTLYDNGETYTRNRLASLRRAQAELKLRMAKDQVCRDVAFAYLDFSLAQRRLEIKVTQSEVLERQAKVVSAQYHQGMRTRKDFLRFRTELKSIELSNAEARVLIESKKSQLRALLGVGAQLESGSAPAESESRKIATDKVDFVALTPENVEYGPFPEAVPDVSKHYEKNLADLDVAFADKSVDLARRRYGPELTLTAGAGYGSVDYIATSTPFINNDQVTWNVLLNLKYNLWDWGIRRHELSAAAETRKVQEIGREARLIALRSELEQLMLDIESLKQTRQFSSELLSMERTSFDLLQTEYRNGRVSYLELIDGLKGLSAAQSAFAEATFGLQKKLIAYRFHEGTLHEKFCAR